MPRTGPLAPEQGTFLTGATRSSRWVVVREGGGVSSLTLVPL